MRNSMVMFTLSVFEWKYPFYEKFVSKNQNCCCYVLDHFMQVYPKNRFDVLMLPDQSPISLFPRDYSRLLIKNKARNHKKWNTHYKVKNYTREKWHKSSTFIWRPSNLVANEKCHKALSSTLLIKKQNFQLCFKFYIMLDRKICLLSPKPVFKSAASFAISAKDDNRWNKEVLNQIPEELQNFFIMICCCKNSVFPIWCVRMHVHMPAHAPLAWCM